MCFSEVCNTVLHNEACDTHRELRRHKAKEVTFSDMTLDEARQLHTFDEYFKREAAETVFEKAGKKITPKLLLEAIRTLPEEKRKAILLYYFEGMNDTEIAELFNTSRSTIQYRRTSSFEKLRKYLEENADEWDEMVTNPATRKMPLFLILSLWQRQRATRTHEDCLAAFQRLHSPPLHAEAVRRARERLFWRRHDIRERLQAKLMMAVLTFKAEE